MCLRGNAAGVSFGSIGLSDAEVDRSGRAAGDPPNVCGETRVDEFGPVRVCEANGEDVYVESSQRSEGATFEGLDFVSFVRGAFRKDDDGSAFFEASTDRSNRSRAASFVCAVDVDRSSVGRETSGDGPIGDVTSAEKRATELTHEHSDVEGRSVVGDDESTPGRRMNSRPGALDVHSQDSQNGSADASLRTLGGADGKRATPDDALQIQTKERALGVECKARETEVGS